MKERIQLFWQNHKYLFLFIILAIFIRANGLNLALVSDEASWTIEINEMSLNDISHIPHPPIMMWVYQSVYKLFGENMIVYRLVPLLFSIINMILVYLITTKVYSKKAAILALALYTTSYWATQAALQVDMDGSSLTTMYLITAYILINYTQKSGHSINTRDNKTKTRVLIGITLGIALLIKYTAILLFATAVLYILIKERSLKKCMQIMLPATIIAALIFTVFPLWAILTDNPLWERSLDHTGGAYYLTLVRPITYLFLWATPLLFYFAILSVWKQPEETKEAYKKRVLEKDLLFILWLVVVFLFYALVISGKAPTFDRYMMPMIPALVILSASFIAKQEWTKKELWIGIISFIIVYIAANIINLTTTKTLVHNISNYLNAAFAGQWNFLFPYTGSSGPFFWISFINIGSMLIMTLCCGGFIINSYIKKRNKYVSRVIMLLLAVSLAYNALLISEFIFTPTQPSHTQIVEQINAYIYENKLQQQRMFTSLYQQEVMFYATEKYPFDQKYQYVDDSIPMEYYQKNLFNSDAIAIILDMPASVDKSKELWQTLNSNCTRTDFTEKGRTAAYLFQCKHVAPYSFSVKIGR